MTRSDAIHLEQQRMLYTIPVSTLKASLHCMAKNDVRHYLNGALLDFRKGRIVSTDGYVLFCGSIGTADHDPVIMPRGVIESVVKSAGKKNARWSTKLTIENGTVRAEIPGAVFDAPLLDDTFPPYEGLVNINPSGEPAQCNPALLLDCYRALLDYQQAEKACPMLYPNGGAGALYAQPGVSAFCLVMPWRVDGELDMGWYEEAPEATKAAA